jgi:hypothetical protein
MQCLDRDEGPVGWPIHADSGFQHVTR